MKKNFVLRLASIFLLVCLFSCCLLGISASAVSREDIDPNFGGWNVDLASTLASVKYPTLESTVADYRYRMYIATCYRTGQYNGLLLSIGSNMDFKIVNGEVYLPYEASVTMYQYWGFALLDNPDFSLSTTSSIATWQDVSIQGVRSYKKLVPQTYSGSLGKSISQYFNPVFNYESDNSIWEWGFNSSDLLWYENLTDVKPMLRLPYIEYGGNFNNGISFVNSQGEVITLAEGTMNSDVVVNWDSGIGGIFKNIITCAGASASDAQPIKYTFKGQQFVFLDPAWFRFEGMTAVRVVLLVSLSLTTIVFLRRMILKVISAQGNGDGE